jgi:hypothetical protein
MVLVMQAIDNPAKLVHPLRKMGVRHLMYVPRRFAARLPHLVVFSLFVPCPRRLTPAFLHCGLVTESSAKIFRRLESV